MGDCRKDDGRLILEGEFTIEHAAGLRDFLLDAARVDGPWIVELSGVTRADITLIQLLVAFAKSVGKSGGQVSCSGLPEYLSSLVEIAGVGDALPPRHAEGG